MDNKEKCRIAKKTSIGGQALMEGIMMRGPKKAVMAVRRPNGEMVLEDVDIKPLFKGKITKIPFVRGLFNFIDSMRVGYSSLMRSADISALEEIRQEEAPNTEGMTEEEKEKTLKAYEKKEKITTDIIMVISLVLSIALVVGLFFFLPTFLFDLCFKNVSAIHGSTFWRSLFEGVIKFAIFLGYMYAVSFMKEIKRTFMYHGAEHKTIFCYESGLELTVENVRKMSRFHPRCGTSFLVIMLIVGILVGMLIPSSIGILRPIIKVLLLPLVMGIGYEIIKFAGKHDNWFIRLVSAPGLWFQRISTKEPTDDMIECAIESLKAVIPDDNSDIIG
jgi:uncharacterized protein YqhQ